jgi:hypothetical protein
MVKAAVIPNNPIPTISGFTMNTYSATQKGPLKIPGYIDKDEVTIINVYWGAPPFTANAVYREGDICTPSVDNGYYYQCTTNGVAAATEPTAWGQVTQTSGTAKFTAIPYDLFVLPSETISTSTWAATTGVTLTGSAHTGFVTSVEVSITDATLTTFELTNSITKSNGEKRDRTFMYKINTQ